MLVVTVTLDSARTGLKTNLAKLLIINDGTGSHESGNYDVRVGRKGRLRTDAGVYHHPQRRARVENYPRNSKHVLNLVARALMAAGYK